MTERSALYALGALSRDETREFEMHIERGCEVCGEDLEAFQIVVEKLGHAPLAEHPPARVRASLFAELAEERNAGRLETSGESITVRFDAGRWREISKGAYVKRLFVDKTRRRVTMLYKLLPGASLPAHRHHETEECFVLEGDYRVNDEVLGPGDYHCALPGSIDRTLYTVGGTMFLLVGPEKYDLLK
jgi:anti-sigma factor ChrR (cupin superfamily)